MEAAAKKVQLLAQRILPDRPHHLSFSPDQRYRVPPDNNKHIEEWAQQRLQYMTFLSDADRGVLLTRPYFDMREEPPNQNPAKDGKTEKMVFTKLSLSDYKNKQKKTSPSPPDSGPTMKPDPPNRDASNVKVEQNWKKVDGGKFGDSEAFKDATLQRPRDAPRDERPLNTENKAKSSQGTKDTPEKRKREQEQDEDNRPQKRTKPETSTPLGDRSRTPRDDGYKRKDLSASQDKTPNKDAKSNSSASLPNGRSILKAAMGSQANKSPVSRARESSVNGNRPSSSGSSKNTPSRLDASSSKPVVPPLLSPLRLSIDDEDAHPRNEKKRRDEGGDYIKPHKQSKLEALGPPTKQKSPLPLPPLLSPTLPPALEAELVRISAKTPSKSSESSQKGALSDSPNSGKKTRRALKDDDEAGTVRRLMVTLKYSKKIAKRVQRLLALPPKKELPRKERSVSPEAPAPSQSRKRPVSSTENVGDTIAVKRPRTSDITGSSRLAAPSTPSKAATAMSRIGSNNSQGNTPADVNSLTPGVPTSSDRPTSHEGKESVIPARVQALRDRGTSYTKLGSKLKHERDAVLQLLKTSDSRNPPQVSGSDKKRSVALGLESAMAYMLAFRAVFDSRRMENKAQDPKQWETILPFLSNLKHDVRVSTAMTAIYWQLQGVILEEMIKCFWSLDPASNAQKIISFERQRALIWKTAFEAWSRVGNESMRANLGPWSSVDDAVAAGLKIMAQWASEEQTGWRAVVTVSMANGAER